MKRTCKNYCAAYFPVTHASAECCFLKHKDLFGHSDDPVCDDAIERGEYYDRWCGDCGMENKSTNCKGCIGREFFVEKPEDEQ